MRPTWPVIRIVLSLIAIFAMGIVVGRLTAPSQNSPNAEITEKRSDISRTGKRVMRRYHEKLQFTEEQSAVLKEKFGTVSRRMEILPRLSRARLAVLEDFHEELTPHLTEAQRKIADEILAASKLHGQKVE